MTQRDIESRIQNLVDGKLAPDERAALLAEIGRDPALLDVYLGYVALECAFVRLSRSDESLRTEKAVISKTKLRSRRKSLEETSGLDDTFNTPAHNPRGHLTDPGNQDTDRDGTDDGTEARLGTSPLNPGEWFHAAISKDALGRPSLSWPSTTGITFTIQRDIDLSGWQNIATGYPGQSGLTTFTDTDPLTDAPRVFYRVALDAP